MKAAQTRGEPIAAVAVQPERALDPVSLADEVLTRFGPRAVTALSGPRVTDDGRTYAARLSANDCYVALPEASRKMARVIAKRRLQLGAVGPHTDISALFPDPAAYLARAIRSVVSDAGRVARREPVCLSLDVPIGLGGGDGAPLLGDTVADEDLPANPEAALLDQTERTEFRSALKQAMRAIPANYMAALTRDMRRERDRQDGVSLAPASESERQTLCRARAALAQVLRSECTADNPYIWSLGRQRNSGVRKKTQPSARWTGERQDALIRRLLDTGWAARSAEHADGAVGEAIVHDVTAPGSTAPPTPEVRKAMRVLDLYTVDRMKPESEEARRLYDEARALRAAHQPEEALRRYRECYASEPAFVAALNEVGVMHSQLGRLREALQVYVSIIEMDPPGGHRFIAATNASDIYLTWFDSGRNRDRNIELARRYAEMAMEHPSPMRACNLILAYVKDRYYLEARSVLESVIRENREGCRADKFLQTLFQIRDADLVTWWTWLEDSLGKG